VILRKQFLPHTRHYTFTHISYVEAIREASHPELQIFICPDEKSIGRGVNANEKPF